MSEFESSFSHLSATSPQTGNASELKDEGKATADAPLLQNCENLDFWTNFGDPFDNPLEIPTDVEGSLERLEELLGPVGEEFIPTFRDPMPPTPNGQSPLHEQPGSLQRTHEESADPEAEKQGLPVQSCETIKEDPSDHKFMDLIEQYALSLGGDPRDSDQLVRELVLARPIHDSTFEEERKSEDIQGQSNRTDDAQEDNKEDTPSLTRPDSNSPPSEDAALTPPCPTIAGPSTEESDAILSGGPSTPTHDYSGTASSSLGKRRRGKLRSSNRPESDANHAPPAKAPTRKTGRKTKPKKARARNALSTEFIQYRFNITPHYAPSYTWRCPYPTNKALPGGECSKRLGKDEVEAHVRRHVNMDTDHGRMRLPCPKHSEDGCAWARDRANPYSVSINSGLPRHVAEVHFQVNARNCPCGTFISRGDRDQFVRHLRDGHRTNLQARREAGEDVPDFVDVDDHALVEEEKRWIARNREPEDEEDDKGEGTSDGRVVKRRRL